MFDGIGGFLTSIISGGVTGILGVAVQRYADYKNKQLDQELTRERFQHERDLREIDVQIMEREAKIKVRVAEIEGEAKIEAGDSAAFAKSFELEPKKYSEGKLSRGQSWVFVLLDFARGLVRPLLTLYLAALSTLIYAHSISLLSREGISLDVGMAFNLIEQITQTILYLFATCTMWYFGSRNRASEAMTRKSQQQK